MIGYDFDGVVTAGHRPSPWDVIITGRSYEEAAETYAYMAKHGIHCAVYFNPVPESDKGHESSGAWKAEMVERLGITKFYEDMIVQAEIIRKRNPDVAIIIVAP